MKNFSIIVCCLLLLIGCKKDLDNSTFFQIGNEDSYIAKVQSKLKDSLSQQDYELVNFKDFLKSYNPQSHKTYLRIGIMNKSIANDFILLQTDSIGNIIKGRMVHLSKDTLRPHKHGGFNGSLAIASLSNKPISKSELINGKLITSNRATLKAEEEPAGTQDLAPVIVTAYTNSGVSYADWYLLSSMMDDYGEGGYWYSPATSGGGGGGSGTATMQVDFEAPESKDAIDIKKYINCFGATQDANATYTVTIAVDLPVDNDPTKIFNWSDASPGHTFIELYKNSSTGLVEQHIGLYPNSAWKTVAGGNVDSKVADDAGHEYQAKYTISVSGAQFANALKAAYAYSNFDYNVASFNCADYALKVFTAAGGQLNVPQFPVPEYSDASNTPQGVYDAIQNQVLAGNQNAMANAQKQWIGDSHGPCN